MKDPYWPCDNPCINGYYDKKNKINVICINTADTSHCKPGKTTSSLNWSQGFASVGTRYQPSQNHSINYSSFDKQFLERTPTTYTRPEFVPYTQPSQPFIEPDRPYAPPEKINPVIVNKKHIDKSVDFRKSKDYENVLKSCDKALKADPKYLDGWNEKAAIYIDKAEYKKAIESCDKAIKIDPKYFYAYNNKAIALRMSGDYEKALKSCDIAIKINPKDLTASNFKSFILKEKTDFEKAIEYSDGTFRIKPSYQMSNFDYFLKLPYLSKVSTIDLSNKQIDDKGAKVLANSLSNGRFPHLKTLRLEGNKITDEGQGFLIDSLKAISQHIVIKFKKYSTDLGQKTIKPALKEFIKYAQEKGIDTTHISTNKPTLEYLKDVGIIGKNIVFGVAKCNYTLLEILTLDTTLPSVVTDIAIEKSCSKILKKGNVQVSIGLEIQDAFVSTEGGSLAIKAVELIVEG